MEQTQTEPQKQSDEISEGNHLMARYIGMQQNLSIDGRGDIQETKVYYTCGSNIKVPHHTMADGSIFHYDHSSYSPPEFHLDWNWLMYAIEHMKKRNPSLNLGLNGLSARIYTNDLETYQTMVLTQAKMSSPIESVWFALKDFIEHYDKPEAPEGA